MKKNINIEAGNLYRKYFIEEENKNEFTNDYFEGYIVFSERAFNESNRNQLKKQFQELCKEYDLKDLHFQILYCYGLRNCMFKPHWEQLKDIDSSSKIWHSEIINAASILYELGTNKAAKEAKIQFSYMAGGILHKAEITDKATIIDLRLLLLPYLTSEEKFYNQKSDFKFTKEYLTEEKTKISNQEKRKLGRPAVNKYSKEVIINVLNFLQEETALKKDSKIISEKQALFIYSYLIIFELIEYKTEFPEESAAYIRAILQ